MEHGNSQTVVIREELCGQESEPALVCPAEFRGGATPPAITVDEHEDESGTAAESENWLEPVSFGVPKFLHEDERSNSCSRGASADESLDGKSLNARRRTSVEEPYVYSLAQLTIGPLRGPELRRFSEPGSCTSNAAGEGVVVAWEGKTFEIVEPGSLHCLANEKDETLPLTSFSFGRLNESLLSTSGISRWTARSRSLPGSSLDTTAVEDTSTMVLDASPPLSESQTPVSPRGKGSLLCLPELPLRQRSLSLECARLEAIAEECFVSGAKSIRRYSSPASANSEK